MNQKNYGLIYIIECLETGEKYVGNTIYCLKKRMSVHKAPTNHCVSKKIIQRGNYKVDIVEENINEDFLCIREQYWMDNSSNIINVKRATPLSEDERKKLKNYKAQVIRDWIKKWGDPLNNLKSPTILNNLLQIDVNCFT